MSVEIELRELIKSRYGSVTAFARECGLPATTVFTVLSKGLETATVSNLIKMCDTLKISADALAYGHIRPYSKNDYVQGESILSEEDAWKHLEKSLSILHEYDKNYPGSHDDRMRKLLKYWLSLYDED